MEDIPKDFMDVVDLYVLLGNILDNALESVKKLIIESDRIVDIHLFRDKNMIRMIFKNHYIGNMTFCNGLPQTTKEPNSNHGYGMKSIQQIVEKYNGVMNIYAKDGTFILKILVTMNKDVAL